MSTLTEKYRTVADLRDGRRHAIGELTQEEESDWAEQLDLLWDDMTDDERCEVDPRWGQRIAALASTDPAPLDPTERG